MSKKDNRGRIAEAYSKATGASYAASRSWAGQGFLSYREPFPVGPADSPETVAGRCAGATGWNDGECLKWAERGFISAALPVPDAAGAEQRRLEALMVYVLANALRDAQLDGAVFGTTRLRPLPVSPVLHLHTEMADAVVRDLLPRFDVGFGGLRGVPGLRPFLRPDGGLELRLLGSRARVRLVIEEDGRRPVLPQDVAPGAVNVYGEESRGVRRLWGSAGALDPAEEAGLRFWGRHPAPAERDLLLSRILRRPAVANLTGRAHGWANTYTHGYEDVVLEWCCGEDAGFVEARFLDSGLVAAPRGTRVDRALEEERPGTLCFGSARAYLRRLSRCLLPEGVARRIRATIRAGYAG